jgi:YrbI family 3-deoxy-D-manno-octulosonate 8-phosphate phosphatase
MVNTALKGTDFRLSEKIAQIKVVITDNDGVLTDTGVYYSSDGEELKRYSVRDGMGVERLRTLTGIDTMIITGENSPSLVKRAEKLRIKNLFLNARNKI